MSDQASKAQLFRSLHVPGKPLVLFNCWDAGSAKAIAASGAAAIATASWAVAAANGYADGEQVPFDLVIGNIGRIARAVDLPVSLDLETGYGSTPGDVGASAEQAMQAGAIGCNLEDGELQGGLRAAAAQGERLAAVRAAGNRLAIPFFINARTDAFLPSRGNVHTAELLDDAIARAHVYAEAGADCLFVPGLVDPALIERLVRASPLPVNLIASDTTPALAVLAQLGVARLSFGPRGYLRTMAGLTEAARAAL